MREKTCASRARYSKITSIGPSRRLDFSDEGGAESGFVPDTYADSENGKLSEDSEPTSPKSSPKTKSSPRKPSNGVSPDDRSSRRLEKKICTHCGKGGQMLVCTESGCPVAFHEKCLPCQPKFDESGAYYCPYCTYKRALEKLERLRRKAALAKQTLSSFLDPVENGCKKARKDGNNREQASSSPLGNQTHGDVKMGDVFKEVQADGEITRKQAKSSPLGNKNQHEAKLGDVRKRVAILYRKQVCPPPLGNQNQSNEGIAIKKDVEDRQDIDQDHWAESDYEALATPYGAYHGEAENDTDKSASDAHEGDEEILDGEDVQKGDAEAVTDQPQEEPSNSCRELVVFGSGGIGNQEPSNARHFREKSEDRRKKQKKQHQVRKATKSSAEGEVPQLKGNINIKTSESDAEAPHGNSSDSAGERQHGNARPENCDSSEKGYSESSTPTRFPKSIDVAVTITNVKQRLRWTTEEEEMLKEGVQNFLETVNKNIPWRKILNYGSHVFNPARRPMDLKEKWKKITAKG